MAAIREQGLDKLSASMDRLVAAMAGLEASLEGKVSDRIAAIQRLLKPAAYIAEAQLENSEPAHIAEVSNRVGHLADAVEEIKRQLLQQEVKVARERQEFQRRDAETQAKVRVEKTLVRAQRRIEPSLRGGEEPQQ